MSLNPREKKLLVLLLVLATICLVAYLIIPQVRNINTLKTEIETNKLQLSSYETRKDVLNTEYIHTKDELEAVTASLEDGQDYLSDVKLYKSITNGEIIVELNKFIPVSPTDKFTINEISFLENEEEAAVSEDGTEKKATEDANNSENAEADTKQTGDESQSKENESNSLNTSGDQAIDDSLDGGEAEKVLDEYGLEANYTAVTFTGYYSSLIKFVENLNNNQNYVLLLSLKLENVALNDPTVPENLIKGEMLIAFPTYPGIEEDTDVYSILDNLYEQNTADPFNPYDGFVIVDESTKNGDNSNSDNYWDNNGSNNANSEEKVVFKTIESFSNSTFFFVTNDTRNGGYVSTSQKSTDGNVSLKLYYDFYNRNNKNVAYAVSENEKIVLDSTPKQIVMDVFNDSANENTLGVVFRDATGNESISISLNGLDFNGWATCTVQLPDNMVYPVVIQRFFVKSGGSGIKQEGTILIDNLRIEEY